MRQIEDTVRLTEKTTPPSVDGSVLDAESSAPGSALIARVDATGLMTSNFFVDDHLGVVDHHFGAVLLP